MLSQLIDWAERGLIPDALIRIAIVDSFGSGCAKIG